MKMIVSTYCVLVYVPPRNCIGLRFALIENKIALTKLLPLYEFVPGKDTPRHLSHMTSAKKSGSFWQINLQSSAKRCGCLLSYSQAEWQSQEEN